jgi:GMP synthase (glutamine-hydrolysing)
MGWHEISVTDQGLHDPVLGHFKKTEHVFQSHGDTFDIPKGAIHLARSALCEGQAFRYGENVYCFQFHLEANQAYVDRWLSLPENQEFMKNSQGVYSPERVTKETKKFLPRSLELSHKAFTSYLKLYGQGERAVVMGSGHGKSTR